MRRSHLTALALLAATASQPAPAQDRGLPRGERVERVPMRWLNANPTALIAAEIALSQLAAAKGQWYALRETAASGARLMQPDPVDADQWLKHRQEPAAPTKWDGQAVWMSCDGVIGVVEGQWTHEAESGRFAAVWQRQQKGGYKWLLRQDDPGESSAPAIADMLSATVADCPPRPERRPPDGGDEKNGQKGKQAPPPVDALTGYSPDKSLFWRSGSDASGKRRLLVQIRKDGATKTVLGEEIEPAPLG